ncbi:MAG: DegT/DnrJ/EryC1/StrS family aminotransferase [Dissulfurispiraceae bacterium]|nr:DegT/DnrJ/EryC1/StrS family aminotransferase [Dissulfurispiraceae bacterium]
MQIPFLDLRVSDAERLELLSAIDQVFCHGRFILGPEVAELESKVANMCCRKYAVGVGSGTEALFLGLKSLGVGPGDEVITTSLSWIATANAIALTGATPVFADINDDLNIDPESVERLVTERTRVILPVHFTGKVCRMDELMQIASKYGLLVVEDASQAFGARYKGKPAGSFGQLACFSMNPMKVFAACGEAGMILTDDEEILDRLTALRYNGMVDKELCIKPSMNGRIDTVQAAILLKRLDHVSSIINKRRLIAKQYDDLLAGIVETPKHQNHELPCSYTYTIRSKYRDELKEFLATNGIETQIQHKYLMPQQTPYKNATAEFENAKSIIQTVLCLPAHEKISFKDIEYVASSIKKFHTNKLG